MSENQVETPSPEEPSIEVRAAEPSPPKRRRLAAILVGLALAVGGFFVVRMLAAPRAPQEPITLAVAFSSGDTYRYRMAMEMDGAFTLGGTAQELDSEMKGVATYRVTSVDEDGVMSLTLSMDDLQLEVNGDQVPAPTTGTTVELDITPDGRIFAPGAAPGGGSDPTQGGGFQQIVPPLPDHPIEPGDEWETDWDQPFPLGEGSTRLTATSRFVRYEEVDGVTAAVVETSGRSTGEGQANLDQVAALLPPEVGTEELAGLGLSMEVTVDQEVEGTYWLDPEAGEVLKVEATSEGLSEQRMVGDFPEEAAFLELLRNTGFDGTTTFTLERI